MTEKTNNQQPNVALHTDNNCLAICFSGSFKQFDGAEVLQKIGNFVKKKPQCIYFSAVNLETWDSSLLLLIFDTVKQAKKQDIKIELKGLPQNNPAGV